MLKIKDIERILKEDYLKRQDLTNIDNWEWVKMILNFHKIKNYKVVDSQLLINYKGTDYIIYMDLESAKMILEETTNKNKTAFTGEIAYYQAIRQIELNNEHKPAI